MLLEGFLFATTSKDIARGLGSNCDGLLVLGRAIAVAGAGLGRGMAFVFSFSATLPLTGFFTFHHACFPVLIDSSTHCRPSRTQDLNICISFV